MENNYIPAEAVEVVAARREDPKSSVFIFNDESGRRRA
jgi:hypothetical protein